MTSFSFTTGNPNNLVANQNASMADIQGPLTDLRTFLNGGTMDETNVPNLAAAFTTYKRIWQGHTQIDGAAVNPTVYGFTTAASTRNATIGAGNPYPIEVVLIDIDPTEFAANARTTKANLRLTTITNTVAPAITFTAGLYPLSTYSGAVNVAPAGNAIGTVISGSTVAIASPGSLARTTAVSGDFNMPAAGGYAVGVTVSAGSAANSVIALVATLSMRQV